MIDASVLPLPTPEQVERSERLVSILMPYATAQRRRLREVNGRFVHYTSAVGGLNIIKSKSLWMRNATTMSDYSEVQHGNRTLGMHPNLQPLLDTLDQNAGGVGTEAKTLFQEWWSDIQLSTYLTSISEHDRTEDQHGRLSMWRAFARASARVALVFRLPLRTGFAQPLGLFMSPVAYFTGDDLADELLAVRDGVVANQEFLRSTDRATLVGFAFFMLLLTVVCLKHEGFREEREWRIMHAPKRFASRFVTSSTEIVDDVPQTIYKIPLEGDGSPGLEALVFSNLLDRVIVGPSPYPWAMYEAFVAALKTAGIDDAADRVFVSGIPIRT